MPALAVRVARILSVAAILLLHAGCYYMQAARGQLEVMRKREPIAEVVNADDTSVELAGRLRLVEGARQFSIDELGLPDNGSYRSYADLERDYVVWNVIAAPEFSLQARKWCYPIVGCVSYRGYFSEAAARRKADELVGDGYDVAFGGVAAYSTLGRFSDPVLNTMMHWDDTELVAVMFHELAHQLLYIKDDSGFNESFATAVEEIGIERWLEAVGRSDELRAYGERRELGRQSMQLLEDARADLERIYISLPNDAAKRMAKGERLARLAADVRSVYAAVGRAVPGWVGEDLNNARLVSINLYHGRLREFRGLYAQCARDLGCFYARAAALAELDESARNSALDALGMPAAAGH